METSCTFDSMYKIIISILLSAFSITILVGQSNIQVPGMPESAVITMFNQQTAWNAGNLDEFMIGYWESDSLLFIGGGGVTSGYEATLERYKRGYPNVESMGHLTFSNRSWTPLGRKTALFDRVLEIKRGCRRHVFSCLAKNQRSLVYYCRPF